MSARGDFHLHQFTLNMTILSTKDLKGIASEIVRMSMITNSCLRLELSTGRDYRCTFARKSELQAQQLEIRMS